MIRNASVSKCFFKIVCGWKVSNSTSGTFYTDTESTNYTEACKIALRLRDVQEPIGHGALVLARLGPKSFRTPRPGHNQESAKLKPSMEGMAGGQTSSASQSGWAVFIIVMIAPLDLLRAIFIEPECKLPDAKRVPTDVLSSNSSPHLSNCDRSTAIARPRKSVAAASFRVLMFDRKRDLTRMACWRGTTLTFN
jgi:hypothetical protein